MDKTIRKLLLDLLLMATLIMSTTVVSTAIDTVGDATLSSIDEVADGEIITVIPYANILTMYTSAETKVYQKPIESSEIVITYPIGQEITVVGEYINGDWYNVKLKESTKSCFIKMSDLTTEKPIVVQAMGSKKTSTSSKKGCLTKRGGVYNNEWGFKETYYNLNMRTCVKIMHRLGYSEADYPYWVDDRGLKHLGRYIMIATNTKVYPKGTILNTSLGEGIVADHCVSAEKKSIIDVAVTW